MSARAAGGDAQSAHRAARPVLNEAPPARRPTLAAAFCAPTDRATRPAVPPPNRFSDYLFEYARVYPDRDFVTLGEQRISYAQAAEIVLALSRALLDSGVQAGDRVAILSTPRPEALLIHLATIDIGAITLGLTTKYQLEELRYVIGDSRPRVLFALPAFEGRDYAPEIALIARDYAIGTVVSSPAMTSRRGRWPRFRWPPRCRRSIADYRDFLEAARRSMTRARARASAAVTPRLRRCSSTPPARPVEPKGALIPHRGLGWTYSLQARRWGIDGPADAVQRPDQPSRGSRGAARHRARRRRTCVFMERFDAGAELRADRDASGSAA